ncbi:uncharacterized protein LOC141936324 isoform X3 [Strix uralensis]|uniref:uncharacterized protein LOC141936324 isoform X3 n=1 Tax=Strix uralensis TaxID=36305 RepID=UPI003DA6E772
MASDHPNPSLDRGPPHHPHADTSGHRGEQNPYWSPAIFVVVALLVLFFTYRRTKGEGSRDRADPASDSSDLGALVDIPIHDTAPIIPAPQEDRRGLEDPPAPEHTETTICELDPPPPQPDTPPAANGPRCSGEAGAD